MPGLIIMGAGIAAVGGLFVWLAWKSIRSPKLRWWHIALSILLSLFGLACLIFGGAMVFD